ncbi:hypothetical protein BDF22DRAFT_744251 [Syncephalis plumigaleata]|nr:hypothetical protein BDF22DRAFT_744251 [Syncephalis plumigaleata]
MPVIDYSNPDDIKRIEALEEKYGMPFDEMARLTFIDFYMRPLEIFPNSALERH